MRHLILLISLILGTLLVGCSSAPDVQVEEDGMLVPEEIPEQPIILEDKS